MQAYAAAVEALGVAAAALAEPPGTQYVTLDAPVLECDVLVVHLATLDVSDAMSQPAGLVRVGPRMLVALLQVTLARCLDVPENADGGAWASALAAAAPGLIADGEAITRALAGHSFAGDCRARSVGPALPVAVLGGVAGWSIPLTVELS